MFPPLISFTICIIILFILIFRRIDIVYGLTIITFLYGFLVFDLNSFITNSFSGVFNDTTFKLLTAFILAFYLSAMLKHVGILDLISEGLSRISRKLAAVAIPSLVGLIPMPGGALVSAMMVKNLYFNKLKLHRDIATYINYWFRHIWVSIWPLYQALILASYILNINVWIMISFVYPSAIAAIISGLIILFRLFKGLSISDGDVEDRSFNLLFKGLWPFLMIIILVIGLKLNIITALIVTIVTVTLIYRPNKKGFIESLKFALSPKIILVVIITMILKEFITISGASKQLYETMISTGIPIYLIAFIIPFTIALVSSGEYIFVAITFPLLINIMMPHGSIDPKAIYIAFFGGYMGLYSSPAHLCLILTTEYFKSRLDLTYRYILLSVFIAIIIAIGLFYIIY